MITRSAVDEELLAEVVTRIMGVLLPWRIILFGSRARGRASDVSDYDFYVELNDAAEETLRSADDSIRKVLPRAGVRVDVKVAALGALERRRDDPGTIEWDVAREGRLLYSDPNANSAIMPSDRVREPSPGQPDSAQDWLEVARRDVKHRDHLRQLPEDWSPEICWLSQQAAEKYLKALLVTRWLRPKRTHDLEELLDALEHSGVSLSALRADCELLTRHAIDPRYTVGVLGPADGRAATEACDRIVAAVLAQLDREPPGTL